MRVQSAAMIQKPLRLFRWQVCCMDEYQKLRMGDCRKRKAYQSSAVAAAALERSSPFAGFRTSNVALVLEGLSWPPMNSGTSFVLGMTVCEETMCVEVWLRRGESTEFKAEITYVLTRLQKGPANERY